MQRGRINTKLISLFVIVFLCMNAGAILCLAYCGQAMKASAEHCPLQKASAHCPHSKTRHTTQSSNPSWEGSSVKCCVLPVSVFAAPFQIKLGTDTAAPVAASSEVTVTATAAPITSRQIPKFYYRPPPNDRRTDRIRNQVFRI
jgi:hypothetical protein